MPDSLSTSSPESIVVRPLTRGEVNIEVAKRLQAIGKNAWLGSLPARDEAQVRRVYDPDDEAYTIKAIRQYKRAARRGKLCVALAQDLINPSLADRVVGYAVAQNEVSGKWYIRPAKWGSYLLRGAAQNLPLPKKIDNKVYARITAVNIDPEYHGRSYQGQGLGKKLVTGVLKGFRGSQQATAYVFEENTETMEILTSQYGLERDPNPQVVHDYFGEENDPVRMHRFALGSVKEVSGRLQQPAPNL